MTHSRKSLRVSASNDQHVIKEAHRILQRILEVSNPAAVEAAVTFAAYVRSQGLNAENYPVFFKILELDNHWVTDAVLHGIEPLRFFENIPPNTDMVSWSFRILNTRAPGAIYGKTLGVILGILRAAYLDARAGFNIHSISIADIINLGKHLVRENGQDDPLNEAILTILEKVGDLQVSDLGSRYREVARQAGKIRSIFFDSRKTLDMAIPASLMIRGDYRKSEVHPSKLYVN